MSVRTAVKSIQDIMRQDSGVDGDAQRISQLCWMFFLKIIDDQDQEFEVTQAGYRSPIPRKLQWRSWAADPEGITGEELLAFVNDDLFPALKSLSVAGQGSNRRRVVRDVFEDAYNYMKSGQLMRQVVNKIGDVDFNDLAERQHFGDIYEQILNDLQNAGNAGEYYTPRAVTAFMVDRIDPRLGEILFDPACGTGGFLTCALRHMRDRYIKRPADEARMQDALRAVEKKPLPHMLCVTNMLLHGVEDPSFVRHDNTLARPYISYTQSDRVDIVLTNPPFGGREEDGIETNFPQHFRTRETADLFLALIVRLLKSGGRAAVVLPDGTLFGEGVKTRLKEHLLEECNLHTIVRLPNSVFKPYASIGTNLLFFEKGEPTKDIWFYEHHVPEAQKAYSMTRPIRFEHLQGCIDWWGGAKRKGREETELAWKVSIEDIKARGYNLDIKNPHTIADDYGDPAEWLAKLNEAEAETAALRDQLKGILAEALLRMNPKQLLAHYEKISDAPDAIPRLRRFVLNLAVRGKLVPQDLRDRSGMELLNRIAKEKVRLVKAREIRRERPLPTLSAADRTFELPPGWSWVRLGDLSKLVTSGSRDWAQHYSNEGAIFVRMGNLSKDHYHLRLDHIQRVKAPSDGEGTRTRLEGGDILISITGDVGMLGLIPEGFGEAYINQHTALVRPMSEMKGRYLAELFRSPFAQDQFNEPQRGIKNSFRLTDITQFVVPLPPLAEQHRIVAKVDDLMALCDKLGAVRAERESRRDRLAASSFARLNTPDPDSFNDDARFALDVLSALTTRPDQVKQLRQTILNLAVRGKLAAQDPRDAPASELLKRIAKAKAGRKKETDDPRIKMEPDPAPGALAMELPGGWAVQSFENLFLFIDYRGNTPPKTDAGIPLITAKNIRMGYLNREPREFISKQTFDKWMTRGFPSVGDLFFTTEAPLANICLNDIDEPFALAQRAICFQPYGKIDTKFLMFALMSDVMQSLIDAHATGMTAKGIKAAKLKPLPIPIPPLAEQHRIVDKIDELLSLCDRLEKSLRHGEGRRSGLLTAILAEALRPVEKRDQAA